VTTSGSTEAIWIRLRLRNHAGLDRVVLEGICLVGGDWRSGTYTARPQHLAIFWHLCGNFHSVRGPLNKLPCQAGTKNEPCKLSVPLQKKGWKIGLHVSNLRSRWTEWFWLPFFRANLVRGLSNKEMKFQNKGAVPYKLLPYELVNPAIKISLFFFKGLRSTLKICRYHMPGIKWRSLMPTSSYEDWRTDNMSTKRDATESARWQMLFVNSFCRLEKKNKTRHPHSRILE